MTTLSDDPTNRGQTHGSTVERGAAVVTVEVRARTADVLRRIDRQLEQIRRATAHRIVWGSLLAGWDDPDDLLRADRWADIAARHEIVDCAEEDDEEDGPEEIVLTLIDEIRLGMSPPE
jgi:hypothetical protein